MHDLHETKILMIRKFFSLEMDFSNLTDPLALILQGYEDSEEEKVEGQIENKSNSTSSEFLFISPEFRFSYFFVLFNE